MWDGPFYLFGVVVFIIKSCLRVPKFVGLFKHALRICTYDDDDPITTKFTQVERRVLPASRVIYHFVCNGDEGTVNNSCV